MLKLHEGGTVTMGTGKFHKQCDCAGSSSGPRTIFGPGKVEGVKYIGSLMIVPFACDVCDKPWKPLQ